jgi:hypothetical protein
MFSCKSDPVLFELTTNVNPIGSGTISPDKGSVWLGDQIEFSAEANTGYSFVKWSGDSNDSISKISLIIDSDINITAEFAEMTKIPDNIFEKYLIEIGIDDKIDGFVNSHRIKKITSLKVLIANDNLISEIDLTFNTELEILLLNNNSIKYLDLTNNINLQIISINENSIQNLDLSSITNLVEFSSLNNEILCIKISTDQIVSSKNWFKDSNVIFDTSC